MPPKPYASRPASRRQQAPSLPQKEGQWPQCLLQLSQQLRREGGGGDDGDSDGGGDSDGERAYMSLCRLVILFFSASFCCCSFALVAVENRLHRGALLARASVV